MITLENVTKHYRTRTGKRLVLDNVSLQFPVGHNVGIFGPNGAGKSTLIRMLAGAEYPTHGRIRRDCLVSFPLGLDSCMHGNLTGRENVNFISRVFGSSIQRTMRYVEEFVEIGAYMDMPTRTYSSGMRAKLAFAICLAIDFDVYLIDEITEVGDADFRERAVEALRSRMLKSDIILVSHNVDTIRTYCNRGAVLWNGRLTLYDSVPDAMAHYRRLRADP